MIEQWTIKPGLSGINVKNLINAYNGIENRWRQSPFFLGELMNNIMGVRLWRVDAAHIKRRKIGELEREEDEVKWIFKNWKKNNRQAPNSELEKQRRLRDSRLEAIREDLKSISAIKVREITNEQVKEGSFAGMTDKELINHLLKGYKGKPLEDLTAEEVYLKLFETSQGKTKLDVEGKAEEAMSEDEILRSLLESE